MGKSDKFERYVILYGSKASAYADNVYVVFERCVILYGI